MSIRNKPYARSVAFFLLFLCIAAFTAAQGPVINEIHYKQIGKTIPGEFVELYNPSDTAIDLGGYYFSAGLTFTFPQGIVIEPDGYIVIAEDPQILQQEYAVTCPVLGPYSGRLDNDGERILLHDSFGNVADCVDYKLGFPWPIACEGDGPSMELINPSLDNNLGGSWRAAGSAISGSTTRQYFVEAASDSWHYRKGTSEPPSDWNTLGFQEDGSWLTAQASIGFGDDDDNTELTDMYENYTTFYMRHSFFIDPADGLPPVLKLGTYIDDGAVFWINGHEVHRLSVDDGELYYDSTGNSHEARWTEETIANPQAVLREGENVLAIHVLNAHVRSSDSSGDATLFIPAAGEVTTGTPTPGQRNSVFSENAPPQIRQVDHHPQQPPAQTPFAVTAKITDPDGVASVTLYYQAVRPGDYIPAYFPLPHNTLLSTPANDRDLNPAFEDPANWSSVPMNDTGADGDAVAGDSIFTCTLPGWENRTLVRYRIEAEDNEGFPVTVPYPDDKSLNFACFVYNGVPPYKTTLRSVQPEGRGYEYSTEVMRSLPVYILITREQDYTECIAYSSAYQIPKSNEGARDKFNWEGAFVYDGVVYDHMRYRLRQANDRYGANGKRSFRFRFNKGRYLEARDNYGRPFPEKYRTLNTGKMFDNKRVGNFGLTETLNHILWNMVGAPAPRVHTFHFRVVKGEDEAPEGNYGQYLGDFHGMWINFEDYDPRFLESHNLEDGNLYKLKDGIFNGNDLRRNQGRNAITDDDDFQNMRFNCTPQSTNDWLNAHVNFYEWNRYHAICEAVRHYDFRPADSHSKNRAYYFEPDYSQTVYGRLWLMPWDSDASWGPSWNSGIDYPHNAIFYGSGKEPFKMNYRNFMREFRDLLWTREVIEQMIDDLAAFITEFAKADRDRWRGAPAAAGYQDFGTMEAKVTDMKNFAFVYWSGSTGPTVPSGGRAKHLDNLARAESEYLKIPDTPTVTSLAPETFPVDQLTFSVSDFSDPQNDGFSSMKWRIGEITPPGTPFNPTVPRVYEWDAVWELTLDTYMKTVTIPRTSVGTGRMYRVRVRMEDDTGRWSHWSDPVEFVAGESTVPLPAKNALRITEIMYQHPNGKDLDFIELCNTGGETIDLPQINVRGGISFSFADSLVTTLEPGERIVLVSDEYAFSTFYDTQEITVAGEYAGNLDNQGEQLELLYGSQERILSFFYDSSWYGVTAGGGYSLVIKNTAPAPELWGEKSSWSPGIQQYGTPGGSDPLDDYGFQFAGDMNQDAQLDLSDAISYLLVLFAAQSPITLPCGDGTLADPSNIFLYDLNGDGGVNIADAVHLLSYLFAGGSPPGQGLLCLPVENCSTTCAK